MKADLASEPRDMEWIVGLIKERQPNPVRPKKKYKKRKVAL